MEAPWPLVIVQKDAKNKYKPPEYINIWGSTRAVGEESQKTGGQETRYLRREYPRNWQEPGRMSRPEWEGGGLSQWQQKDITKKGATTGVDRDVVTLRAEKWEQIDGVRGGRNGHVARVFRSQ